MDDARSLKLSRTEYIDANNVRIFLRVNTLAEITDHNGHQILATYYTQPTDGEQNPNPSGSTLNWPTQSCPGKRAWRTWRLMLSQLYLNNRGLDLRRPLGPWNSDHTDTEWHWHWKVCPTTLRLFRQNGTHWKSYALTRQTRTSLSYETPDQHESIPPNKAVLVTVAIMNSTKVIVQLPLPDIRTPQIPTKTKPKYLITKLTTPPHKWE